MDQQEQEKTTSITLPPEVWLDILSRCSYFDLKKVQRVSKSFNDLIKTPRLDSILFRAQPDPSTLTTETRPLLHPVFELVDILTTNPNEMIIPGIKNDYPVLGQTIAESEFVTYPSSIKVDLLGIADGARIEREGRDKKGLKIVELLEMIANLWDETYDDGLPFRETDEPWDGEGCGLASDDWYDDQEEQPNFWEDLLEITPGARYRGWEKPRVKDCDTIVLKTRPYTS